MSALLGWCIAGDHDTDDGRGGCPIAIGTVGPCPCACHGGATEARELLPPPEGPDGSDDAEGDETPEDES